MQAEPAPDARGHAVLVVFVALRFAAVKGLRYVA